MYSAACPVGNDYPRPPVNLVVISDWEGFAIWEKLSGGAIAGARWLISTPECKPHTAAGR
jgi:hypothetical protein